MPTHNNETLQERYARETYADFKRLEDRIKQLEDENAALRRMLATSTRRNEFIMDAVMRYGNASIIDNVCSFIAKEGEPCE